MLMLCRQKAASMQLKASSMPHGSSVQHEANCDRLEARQGSAPRRMADIVCSTVDDDLVPEL